MLAVLAGTARAEPAMQWFVGSHLDYSWVDHPRVRQPDGKGWSLALEGGVAPLRFLSVSVVLRRGVLHDRYTADTIGGGTFSDYTSRRFSVGPRLDLWPVPGRIRLGVLVARMWDHYTIVPRIGDAPDFDAKVTRTLYEFQVGVVPVRWRGVELELNAGYSSQEDFDGKVEWYSTGLTLRWRRDFALTSSSAARPPSQAPAATAAR